jgi:hypothetical protein
MQQDLSVSVGPDSVANADSFADGQQPPLEEFGFICCKKKDNTASSKRTVLPVTLIRCLYFTKLTKMITKILKKGKNSTISSLFAGIVVIMAMFMVVACEKDETSVANQQQTVRKPQPISDMELMQYLPEVVDGRLVFKDNESYEILINWISVNQDNPERIASLFSNIPFTSMNSNI